MNNSINQYSYGTGDNIAGNLEKHFHSILPESLISLVKTILSSIQNREIDEALNNISIIEGMSNKDIEVNYLIELLRIKCQIISGDTSNKNIKDLNQIMLNSKSSLIVDLALSVILRMESSDSTKAIERYNSISTKGIFSRSVYFELLAELSELRSKYSSSRFSLSEYELIGIILGAFNKKEYDFASEVANHFFENFGGYNADVLLLFSKAFLLNDVLTNKHYWLISSDEKAMIDNIANKVIELIETSSGKDLRLFNIACPLFDFTFGYNKYFSELCYKYISSIELIDSQLAFDIKVTFDEDIFDATHPLCKLRNVQKSVDSRREFIENIKIKKSIEYDDFKILEAIATKEEINNWIISGGFIYEDDNHYVNNFFKLIIVIYSLQDNQVDEVFNDIVSDISEVKNSINLNFINDLSNRLIKSNNPYYAGYLILHFIHLQKKHWCSPLINTLTIALYNSGQYLELKNTLNKINHENWSNDSYYLNIQMLMYHNDYITALQFCSDAIVKYPNELEFYSLKAYCLSKLNYPLADFISSIDISIVKSSEENLQFLSFLLLNKFHDFFEKIVIQWYLDNPIGNCKIVSQACLNFTAILNDEEGMEEFFKPSKTVGNAVCGVVYSDSGKHFTKLIVNEVKKNDNTLLLHNSPVAKTLLRANKNELTTVEGSIKKVILEEIIPPYVAVYRLSMNLRNEMNDGSDCFQSYILPSDPTDIISFFKENLPDFSLNNQISENAEIPLSLRSHNVLSYDPVRASIASLIDKDFVKKELYSLGEINSTDLYIDLKTVIYLCLTSLNEFFENGNVKLFTSKYVIGFLNEWVDKIDNDKFLTMGKDTVGNIIINSSKTIRESSDQFLHNIKMMIKILHKVQPVIANEPKEVSLLRNNLELSLRDGLYISFGLGLHFFSVDSQLCFWLDKLSNIKVCNSYYLLEKAANYVNYSKRETGIIYHLINDMPNIFFVKDFESIATSKSEFNGILLAKAIEKYSDWIAKNTNVHVFLAEILTDFIFNSIKKCKFNNLSLLISTYHPSGFFVERVFNACCDIIVKSGKGNCAEERLALFIVMVYYLNPYSEINKLIVHIFLEYLSGHFLDGNYVIRLVNDYFVN
ncbi:hypothetical protein [Brenneria tiliae]|uniref:Uncharacterized protein n=1 Tax=Brenneria tiliae TaxID=2914984 RepID=A0ABT0MTN6_9GAMM|nr:hypothetical protein [Brenneria tiliae]MCL2893206.1 hypothetical protein [Brenneria tiliae]